MCLLIMLIDWRGVDMDFRFFSDQALRFARDKILREKWRESFERDSDAVIRGRVNWLKINGAERAVAYHKFAYTFNIDKPRLFQVGIFWYAISATCIRFAIDPEQAIQLHENGMTYKKIEELKEQMKKQEDLYW